MAHGSLTGKSRQRLLRDMSEMSQAVAGRMAAWTPRAHFTADRPFKVGRTSHRVSIGVHVVPGERGYRSYRAIVSLQPRGAERFSWTAAKWNPALRAAGWYQACERVLARYGYRGKWRPSPWGRMLTADRAFTTRTALVREMTALEQLFREPWEALSSETAGQRSRGRRITTR